MDLDTAFEQDLGQWLAQVYQRIEDLARAEEHRAVEGVLERENRLLILLVVILGLSIVLLPFTGGAFMIAALVLLYIGALGSSLVTVMKIRRLERSAARREAIRRRQVASLTARPPLGPDERAQLIRIVNLSRLLHRPRQRGALGAELDEAIRNPVLAGWPALEDARALLEEPVEPRPDE